MNTVFNTLKLIVVKADCPKCGIEHSIYMPEGCSAVSNNWCNNCLEKTGGDGTYWEAKE